MSFWGEFAAIYRSKRFHRQLCIGPTLLMTQYLTTLVLHPPSYNRQTPFTFSSVFSPYGPLETSNIWFDCKIRLKYEIFRRRFILWRCRFIFGKKFSLVFLSIVSVVSDIYLGVNGKINFFFSHKVHWHSLTMNINSALFDMRLNNNRERKLRVSWVGKMRRVVNSDWRTINHIWRWFQKQQNGRQIRFAVTWKIYFAFTLSERSFSTMKNELKREQKSVEKFQIFSCGFQINGRLTFQYKGLGLCFVKI